MGSGVRWGGGGSGGEELEVQVDLRLVRLRQGCAEETGHFLAGVS